MNEQVTPSHVPEFAKYVPAILQSHLSKIHDYTPPIATLQRSVPEHIKISEDRDIARSLQLISAYLSLPILEDNFVEKEDERNYRKDKMEEDARNAWEQNMLRVNKFVPVHDAIDILGGRPEIGQRVKTHENKDVFVRNGYYLAEFEDAFRHESAKTIEQKRAFDAKKKKFVQEYSKFIAEVFDAAVEAPRHEDQ